MSSPAPPKPIAVTTRLEPELYQALQRLADFNDRSLSAELRVAVRVAVGQPRYRITQTYGTAAYEEDKDDDTR